VRGVRRAAMLLALSIGSFAATAIVSAPVALAHPLGNFTINHYSGLSVSPGHVRVTYALDMAEIPTFQQRSALDANGDGTVRPAERAAWAKAQAAGVATMLSLSIDGRRVTLRPVCGAAAVFRPGQGGLDVLRMVATFDAVVPAAGALSFHDRSFHGRIGWKEVTASASGGVTLTGSTVPATSTSDELLRYPTNLLTSPLSVTDASAGYSAPAAASSSFASLVTWRLTPAVLIVSLLLAFAFGVLHALGPGHGKTITAAYLVGSGARVRQAVGVGVAVASMHTLSVLALGTVAVALSSSFPAERIYPWLTVLTGAVALALGAGLLVVRTRGLRRGQAWHGHSHPWDRDATASHASGHGDHIDQEGGGHVHVHDHAEGHGHDGHGAQHLIPALVGAGVAGAQGPATAAFGAPETLVGAHDASAIPGAVRPSAVRVTTSAGESLRAEERGAVSRPKLAALAVSGGILPSPTALVVLLAAFTAHRVAYGLSLIVAFSFGLASALIAIALVALRAKRAVDRHLGSRIALVLPLLSAAVILGFGLYFLVRGALQVTS
jgi:nickel/cobalt transporter (NicO) family protein